MEEGGGRGKGGWGRKELVRPARKGIRDQTQIIGKKRYRNLALPNLNALSSADSRKREKEKGRSGGGEGG